MKKILVFSWTVLYFWYLTIIDFTVRPYYLILTYFVSSIYLWHHCKYMTVYHISFLNIYVYFFLSNTRMNYFLSYSQQTTSSKVLAMQRWQVIFGRRSSKNKINKLTVTPRGIYFCPSSNNTESSPPYHVVSKIKQYLKKNIMRNYL